MSNKPIDISGQRFGRLLALSSAESTPKGVMWNCKCDCGSACTVLGSHLRSGNTNSCGCLHRERILLVATTHGYTHTSTYKTWGSMKQRCLNPKNPSYKNYGGRGIKLCERWMSFGAFLSDMGPRPKGKSIERLDNDGNYEPSNCAWATIREQANNCRKNRFVEFRGNTVSISEAHRISQSKIRLALVYDRIQRGWTIDEALTSPLLSQADREIRKARLVEGAVA